MDLDDLKSAVMLEFAATPQKQAKALAAVESVRSGIAELAQLGHQVALVELHGTHEAPVPEEFPKMLYRTAPYPVEITVENEEEEVQALKDGYASRVPADVAQVEELRAQVEEPAQPQTPAQEETPAQPQVSAQPAKP